MKTLFIIFLSSTILLLLLCIGLITVSILCRPKKRAEQYRTMKMWDDLAKKYNITYFITCGTLLGSVRGKDLIPWDNDIDICILAEDHPKVEKLQKDLENSDYTVNFSGAQRFYNNKKIWIDLYFIEKVNDRYQYTEDWARERWPKEYYMEEEIFPLTSYRLGELELPGPNQHLPYLERVYGKNWKIPQITSIPVIGKLLLFCAKILGKK